jgi:hypothetical protein
MGYKSSYEKWKKGESLNRSQSMEANCFECNGYSAETNDNCLGEKSCALYPWSTWGKSLGLRPVTARGMNLKKKK